MRRGVALCGGARRGVAGRSVVEVQGSTDQRKPRNGFRIRGSAVFIFRDNAAPRLTLS